MFRALVARGRALKRRRDLMSMQATGQDDKRRNARAADKATAKKPSFFKMRAQMLDKGRTNTPLARTDNMWAILKVYASGGENGLHTHPNEDHTFIVLQGSARYYDVDGGYTDVGKHEGIMLPAGLISAASRCPAIRGRTSACPWCTATASSSSSRRRCANLSRFDQSSRAQIWRR